MSEQIKNILLVGVGGQGILLASEILSEAAMLAGFDVKKSEIHGMSQRGGSVVSHVRYGLEVFSPIVPEGEGDILFGFELLETMRSLPLLKPGGTVVANDLQISPPSVLMGQETYPEELAERIKVQFADFMLVDGPKIAAAAGNAKAANTVLLGVVSKRLNISETYWLKALEKMVPVKALEINKRAFLLGREL
ncbi:MAG: indolepyruvate oxidoreductase subunit beta [Desulfuromonadaceae bacterium]|nr:indolepyruvate oxidoreductase subunit beta [Desulfuromonadaceae bacterium]